MKLFVPLFLFSFLNAKVVAEDEMSGIYTEAILFVSIFTAMSIFSIIVSKRNAKKFEEENPLEERKAIRRKNEKEKELTTTSDIKVDRILELYNMAEKNIITQREFEILKEGLNVMNKDLDNA